MRYQYGITLKDADGMIVREWTVWSSAESAEALVPYAHAEMLAAGVDAADVGRTMECRVPQSLADADAMLDGYLGPTIMLWC